MNGIHFNTYGRTVVKSKWRVSATSAASRIYIPHSEGAYYVSDGKKTPFLPGFLYLMPSALGYKLSKDADSEFDHTFFDFEITPPLSPDAELALRLDDYPVLRTACDYIDALFNTFNCKSAEFLPLVESVFENLLFVIGKLAPLPRISDTRITDAIAFIHKNYNRHITVRETAARVCLDESHFIRLFCSVMNMTPYQYIKWYRIEMAIPMLRSRQPVKEISSACGFESVSAFSHSFKKALGVSPSMYVKSISEDKSGTK